MSSPGAPAPSKFPQKLAQANAEHTLEQRLSWVPPLLVPVLLFWSYAGTFHHQPGFERTWYVIAAVALASAILLGLYEFRRRKLRAVLCVNEDMVGIYKGGTFCYAFPHDQLVRYDLHPFNTGRLLFVTGVLALGSLAIAFLDRKGAGWGTVMTAVISIMLWGIFVSNIRSRVLSIWFYVPTGKGKSKLMFFKR